MAAVNPAFALLGEARQVLLLQGPVGPFFDRLAAWLLARGTQVTRVVFQGGDRHDSRALAPQVFDGTPAEWPAWLRRLLQQDRTDCIVLFGQSRLYHRDALAVAAAAGIPVVVLEEGYFRPGFVTMEIGGVNSHSITLDEYRWEGEAAGLAPQGCRWHFAKTAWHAARHYAAMWLSSGDFPYYQHHRPRHPVRYAAYWLRSWTMKAWRAPRDLLAQRALAGGGQGYFFVPLQHDGDAQITHHSGYPRNVEFIVDVMRSFAQHAPAGARLVLKQHPQSRGGPAHGTLIRSLAYELGLGPRVTYLVEGDTRVLARHAAGVVLINSTVGLQALEAGTPLIVMGEALYKRPGLTAACSLDQFWQEARPADAERSADFLRQLKNLTQMPASIYAGRGDPLAWP